MSIVARALYGEWLPDQPSIGNACKSVLNVIPQGKGYGMVRAIAPFAAALDSQCLAAISCRNSSGGVETFAADAGKIYKQGASSFTDVSKVGGYAAPAWEFAKYGQRIIATSIQDGLQYYDMGVSALFANLAGSPPKARHIAVVRDFVVLGSLLVGATDKTETVAWSGYNNSETWTSSIATQADSQELFGNGGEIVRIVGGARGVIFQQRSIWVMTYTGAPTIFRFDEVEPDRGCNAGRSVCQVGGNIFYWGTDGFYMFNGAESVPIGSEKIDRFIAADLDTSQLEFFVGAADHRNGLVFWIYPSLASGKRRIVVFSWKINKWTPIDQEAEYIFSYLSQGYNLDTLDSILIDIDSDSIPVDTPLYQGGVLQFGIFDNNHQLSALSGDYLPATLETGDIEVASGRTLFVEKARSLTESTDDESFQWAGRDRQSQNFDYGAATYTANSYGEISLRKTARYHRIKHTVVGRSDHITGIELTYREAGKR